MGISVALKTLLVFISFYSNNIKSYHCIEFSDVVEVSINTHYELEIKLSELVAHVDAETEELDGWRTRVQALELLLEEARQQKTELLKLSRRKRNIPDPNLGFFVGKPGLPGRPGTPGRPGAVGRRGVKGHKGPAGKPGLRGPIGPYGPPGWRGPPGFIGAVGIKGEKGTAGFDGVPGIIGDYGLVGINGEHGQMGPRGYPGHVGFIGMSGPPGLAGDTGPDGIIGEPGVRGRVGAPGPVGFYGEAGLIGELGFMGPPGEMGMKGLKGERGEAGDIGDWGPVGQPGPIYDPHAGLFNAGMMQQAPGAGVLENCTDVDNENETTPNCESYDGMQVYAISSKSFPQLKHPPPGAPVMPAPYGIKKSPVVYGPSKSLFPADTQGEDTDGSDIDYYDDEDDTDILSKDDYDKMTE